MKLTFILLTFCLASFILSCSKNCNSTNQTCKETSETNPTTCMAYFESYFYDKEINKCVKQGYSGCSSKGFETIEECQECLCNN